MKVAFATFGDGWGKVVAALTKDGHKVRTEFAVINKVTALELREKDERRSSGDWDQRPRPETRDWDQGPGPRMGVFNGSLELTNCSQCNVQ